MRHGPAYGDHSDDVTAVLLLGPGGMCNIKENERAPAFFNPRPNSHRKYNRKVLHWVRFEFCLNGVSEIEWKVFIIIQEFESNVSPLKMN